MEQVKNEKQVAATNENEVSTWDKAAQAITQVLPNKEDMSHVRSGFYLGLGAYGAFKLIPMLGDLISSGYQKSKKAFGK